MEQWSWTRRCGGPPACTGNILHRAWFDLGWMICRHQIKGLQKWLLVQDNTWLMVTVVIQSVWDLDYMKKYEVHSGTSYLMVHGRNKCSWHTLEIVPLLIWHLIFVFSWSFGFCCHLFDCFFIVYDLELVCTADPGFDSFATHPLLFRQRYGLNLIPIFSSFKVLSVKDYCLLFQVYWSLFASFLRWVTLCLCCNCNMVHFRAWSKEMAFHFYFTNRWF